METLTREYELPSNGYLGGPTKVSLRPMTTKEEKLIFTAKDTSFIEKIVKSCTVEPKELKMSEIHTADITYLLYMLRELTFGPIYQQQVYCPNCGHKQLVDIDITEMTYNKLDIEHFSEISTIKLPVCGDEIVLKLISQAEVDEITDTIRRMNKSGKLQDPEGYEYIYRFAKLIHTINGEEYTDMRELLEYVDNLNLRDFNEVKKVLADIKIGINTNNTRICSKCEEEMEVQGLTVPEFFRSF